MCVPAHNCCNGKRETHTFMMSKQFSDVWRHTQPRTRARMYGDKREEDTAVVAVVDHHVMAEREGPPGVAVV